ncbi:MAG: hypothetical protein ABSH51_01145 [Solirubrobacteraceae bacterium]|jgi:hypothetical protein
MAGAAPARRRRARWSLLATAVAALAAGCGSSHSGRGPTLSGVPLVGATRIVAHVRRCDSGANPYCAVQLVVVGDGYASSGALAIAESRHLSKLGWSSSQGDFGLEGAADSPGHGLRLTYAPANLDLEGIDLGWITRAPLIAHALSSEMFDRAAAMSLMLETGSS